MDVRFPIGQLAVPEVVTKENIASWLKDIASYTKKLRETVDNLSEEQLNKTYREGAWNVRQLVHHIADSQLAMYHRLKIALTTDAPQVAAFNEEGFAKLQDSNSAIESSLRLLEGMNERIVELGATLTEDQLKRVFIMSDDGETTVETTIAKLCWHEEHHLAHIKVALGQWSTNA